MQTSTPSSTLIRHVLTLLIGSALAAGLWAVGSADLSWLGFAAAATHAETPSGCRALARLLRRAPA